MPCRGKVQQEEVTQEALNTVEKQRKRERGGGGEGEGALKSSRKLQHNVDRPHH